MNSGYALLDTLFYTAPPPGWHESRGRMKCGPGEPVRIIKRVVGVWE